MHFPEDMKSVVFVALIGLLACAPASQMPQRSEEATVSEVRLLARTSGTARVLLTLENNSSEQIGYNLCASTLERWNAGEWTQVPLEENCTRELRTLDPLRSVAYEKDLPRQLSPGEYRYVTSVESPLGASQRPLASVTFRVI